MSVLDKEILKIIKKIRLRIHRNIMLSYMLWGSIIALCLGSIVSLVSLIIPLYKPYLISIKLVFAGVIVSLIVSFIKAPKNDKVAKVADSLGLNERVETSMELIGIDDEGFALLQKKDTIKKLQKLDYKSKLRFTISRKQVILSFIFIFIITGSLFIPTPAKSKAKDKYKFEIMQEEKVASIEKVEKDIKKDNTFKEEDRKELLDNLNSLKKEIEESKSVSDIDKSQTKFQMKTDDIEEKYKENDLNNITSSLSQNQNTANLAQAIESGDKHQIEQEVNNLSETFNNASEEEQNNLAKNFDDMSKNTADEALKKSLKDISDNLPSNNQDKASALNSALKELNDSLQKAVDKKQAASEIKDIQKEFTPSDQNNNNESGSQNSSDNKGGSSDSSDKNENSQDGNAGSDQNSSNGGGSTQNSNSGSNSGDKNSDGKNQGGSSSSSGSSTENNGSNNSNSSGNSGSGRGSGSSSSGITKPQNSDSSKSEDVYVPSSENDTGNSEIVKEGTSGVEQGKSQDLEKVIGKYKEKAYENMNSYIIPDAMKDIIKGYFSSLEQ